VSNQHIEIAIQTFAAIQNYEVIVTEWEAFFPKLVEDREKVPSGEKNTVYRMLLDRKSSECLIVKRILLDVDESSMKQKGLVRNLPIAWSLDSYRNGVATSRLPRAGQFTTEKFKFDEFFTMKGVPAVEFAGLFYPPVLRKGLQTVLDDKRKLSKKGGIKQLPDGTVSLYCSPNPDVDYVEKTLFDRRTLMPTEFSTSAPYEGTKLTEKYVTAFEEINGIFRPTRIDFEKIEWQLPRNSKNGVPLDAIGKVTIEWLQFNEPELVFPKDEDLGFDPLKWAQFLRIIDK